MCEWFACIDDKWLQKIKNKKGYDENYVSDMSINIINYTET